MAHRIFDISDNWLKQTAPATHVAISSRARYARNLAGFPFSPHARPEILQRVDKFIQERVAKSEFLKTFDRLELCKLGRMDRRFLKESRVISKEMERGGEHLMAYVSPDGMASILVNEEDHLRIQVIRPGLNIAQAVERLDEIDNAMSKIVGFAYSEKLGYLTACPTNVGTGFRASVMLHLPGLTLLKEVENALQGITHHGLTVRGFDGENSDFTGDLYQISNEITLGRSVEQIVQTLESVIQRIVEKEEEARLELFKHHEASTEDYIWRSFGLLHYARKIDSTEAMMLLSRIRLGIDQGYFQKLGHEDLNKLVFEIQPAHLEHLKGKNGNDEVSRDELRALYLRERILRSSEQN